MGATLKAARHAHGWTGTQLATQLRHAAAGHGVQLPAVISLRRMNRRWESGQYQPTAFYRRLLCQVYRASPAQLGLTSTEPDTPADTDAVTALLYAAPVNTGDLVLMTLPIARQYIGAALDHPHCPDPATLATGLRRARAQPAPWLDRTRLIACEYLALALTDHANPPTDLPPTQVPDWLTGSRTAAAGLAAHVFATTG